MTFPKALLDRNLGVAGGSGRLAPENWVQSEGGKAFVLGSDALGVVTQVTVGEYVEVTNIGDLFTGGYSYVRFRAHFRPPATMPVGVTWRATFWVDDGVGGAALPDARITYDLTGDFDREITRSDFAMPLLGVMTVAASRIRAKLELIGTAGEYDVELPGVYLDEFILDTALVRPTFINRIPEPDEIGTPVTSLIAVEINDPNTTAIAFGSIDLLRTQIFVNGALAYDGNAGGFQAGFTGPSSAVSTFDYATDPAKPHTTRVVIDPTSNLPSSTTIPILVKSARKAGPQLQVSYSFTTEDLTAPQLVSASGTAAKVVRVVATEPLRSSDPADVNDALNPGNWTLLVASTTLDDGLPAVTPVVVSVTKVDDKTFDLVLDVEQTRRALYFVIGDAIYDAFTNMMTAPNNRALFAGFGCAQPDGRDFALIEMIPEMNVNEDESGDLKKFIAVFQEVTDLLLCDIDSWGEILDPDFAPERFVDAMLADLGNPFSFDLSEIDKRRLVRVLVPLYQLKGTDPGIINAVRFFLGLEVEIVVPAFDDTWILGVDEIGVGSWLGTSNLHDRLSFYVKSGITLTDDQRSKITSIVIFMKDARTHFLGFQEPTPPPPTPDHWELGLSELGTESFLH